MIKRRELIKGIEIFDYYFLFTAYADESIFFRVYIFQTFLEFSGLKPNIGKYETAGIGLLKRAIEAICELKLVDLSELRY